MKNVKIAIILFGVQSSYIATILLACVWDSTMFTALRVLTYMAWGLSLLCISQGIRRYERSRKNRRKALIIYAIGCISVLTAQFISAVKPNLVFAMVFAVFLFIIYLVELILVQDIRKTALDETIKELENHPNKELFVGLTKERDINNHSLLVTAFFFGIMFTFIGVPVLCSQDYFLGLKAMIFLYAWDIAILLMRYYMIKVRVRRLLIEVVCFHISMICLSITVSRLEWAMEQTMFQLGCIVSLLPIVIGILRDIRRIRREK